MVVVFDEVKVTLSSHQTRGGSVGGGGGLRKWDGGDKDDDGGNSGNPVSTIRGKCKCHTASTLFDVDDQT